MSSLFSSIEIGDATSPNRIFMAPCTRNRAEMDEVPTPMMAIYYGQRASAGLLISEGVNPEPRGRGYYRVPGAYTAAHRTGWQEVARAVTDQGGRIFAQIMHCGRLSVRELQPGGELPIAPSAVPPSPTFRGMSYGCPKPDAPYPTPRPLETDEIPALIESYAAAARLLVDAGLDGVELHGASGYLPMQFLSSNTNLRNDSYGGSIERRARFLLDVIDAMTGAVGAGRVAVKLSPAFRFHDVHDEDPVALYTHVARMLSDRGLAYVQVSDYGDYYSHAGMDPIGLVRAHYNGVLVANGGLNAVSAQALLDEGKADAVAFGSAFMANPDLPERMRRGSPLNVADPNTFYTGDAHGYIDYPFLGQGSGHATVAQSGTTQVDYGSFQHGRAAKVS
ncbi:12-oxophytodienoate reductase [Sphingobium chlorophenolicum L-1]|uniref:12-oxophytodienoate reductase n=1 Tax=Sphingobium chlorophenolicum L-1 TaxID=690566 RepID=F6F372_SPHCR|nr:alkene reductase [Sphingobium chlorophenolicum]AEG50884.1 12-oxophytodienoate reductase [Sphingobium chlorophenolicum L-1]